MIILSFRKHSFWFVTVVMVALFFTGCDERSVHSVHQKPTPEKDSASENTAGKVPQVNDDKNEVELIGDRLCNAALNGHFNELRKLIEEGAPVNEPHSISGWTALTAAATWEHKEIVVYLIQHGANVNVVGLANDTPLYHAARRGNLEIVKLLLEAGADPALKTKFGSTPLTAAVSGGHLETAKILLKARTGKGVRNLR